LDADSLSSSDNGEELGKKSSAVGLDQNKIVVD
jgi:hypothetical protein